MNFLTKVLDQGFMMFPLNIYTSNFISIFIHFKNNKKII